MSVRGNCWLTLGLAFCLIATRRRTAQTPFSHMPEKLSAPIPVRPVDFFETIQDSDLAHPKGFEPLASAFGELGSKPFILILQSFFCLKQIDFAAKT